MKLVQLLRKYAGKTESEDKEVKPAKSDLVSGSLEDLPVKNWESRAKVKKRWRSPSK